MAWTANVPAAADKLATSQPHILNNYTELNTAIGLEHARMTDATAARSGGHKFRVGDSTAQAAITAGIPLTGGLFIRTDVSLTGASAQYYTGSAWATLGIDDSAQSISGTKTFVSAAVFTDTVTLGADPTTALGAATKQYVDRLGQLQGLVVSTSNLTLSGEQTLDGVLTSADTILVAGQTDTTENGLYVTAAGAWARLTGFTATDTVQPGLLVAVKAGTINTNTVWHLQHDGTNDTITPGTHAQVFTLVAGDVFVSSEVTIAAAAVATQAHGLGEVPRNTALFLRCKTTDAGWAVDDEVDIANVQTRDGSNLAHTGAVLGADATNLILVQDSVQVSYWLQHKSTGVITNLTNGSWRLVARASKV